MLELAVTRILNVIASGEFVLVVADRKVFIPARYEFAALIIYPVVLFTFKEAVHHICRNSPADEVEEAFAFHSTLETVLGTYGSPGLLLGEILRI